MSFEDASAQDTWRVRYLEELPPVGGALETVTLTPVEDGAETPFVLDCPGVAPEASPIEQPVRSECDDFEGALEEVLATYPREQVDAAESELGGVEEASSSILWEYGHPDVQVGGYPSFAQSDAWRDRAEDLLLFQDETIDEAIVEGATAWATSSSRRTTSRVSTSRTPTTPGTAAEGGAGTALRLAWGI